MTATAARPQADEDNDWRHGPVAASFNTAVGTLFATALGKTLGMPPWVAFLATAVMAAAVIVSGLRRYPRPLSRESIAYRTIAVTACGAWMWAQLATFPDLGLGSTQAVALVAAWPVTILVCVGCFGARRLPGLLRIAAPAVALLFSAALTLTLGGHVVSWLNNVLFVTSPMPSGWVPVGKWLWTSLLTLVIIAAPMAVIGRHTANREETAAEEALRAAAAAMPQTGAQARKFLHLVCDSTGEWKTVNQHERGVPPVKVPRISLVSVDPWENGAGETYVLNLTEVANATVKTLRANTDLWAQKMALPAGCGIEVHGDGDSRGVARVKVNRINVLKKTLPYPELMCRSIMHPMPLGQTRDGKEIGPYFRENSCFLWGQKGSGKTGVVFDIIAGTLQCTDALVWVIDLNGGAAAKPFLRPWAHGRVDRPGVDWVASTMAEALVMTEVALAIAVDRKVHYADLKFQHNTNLMPVGNGEPGAPPPEIVIVIDEGKTILGSGGAEMTDVDKQVRHNLNQIMDLARDAAVNIVFSGLRATADVADTAFKANTTIRIGMRVTDDAELAYGFGDYTLNGGDIPYRGSGFISTGHEDDGVQVFKAYFLDPKRNYEVGLVTTAWRPYMDQRGMQIGGVKYANRWQRTVPWLWEANDEITQDRLDEMASYGAVPATAADRAAAASAVAGAQQPAPTSGINTSYYQPPTGRPGEATYSDVARIARESREAFFAGTTPDSAFIGGVQQPDEPPRNPPAEPPAAIGGEGQDPEDADDLDEPTEPDFEARFRRLAEQLGQPGGVLPDNPENMRRNRMPVPLPPESEIAANPRSREVVERIVLTHGPLAFGEIHKMLGAGGAWGPATPMTGEGLRQLLKRVDWLAPRARGEKYQHVNNVKRTD